MIIMLLEHINTSQVCIWLVIRSVQFIHNNIDFAVCVNFFAR
jgi:hypothetical protein